MEENKINIPLMNEGTFKEYVHNIAENNKMNHTFSSKEKDINLMTYEAVSKFKSVRRAIKRGHVSPQGVMYPNRPFNNRKKYNERGVLARPLNERKKALYEEIKFR